MDPFGQEDSLKDDILPKEKNDKVIFFKKMIIYSIIVLVWITIVIIELSVVFSSDNEENNENENISSFEINCFHEIPKEQEILLINEIFENNKNIEIYINETKIK